MKDLYKGPIFQEKPKPEAGEYTAADQARGFGVPEEELEAPPSGLSKSEWARIRKESKQF